MPSLAGCAFDNDTTTSCTSPTSESYPQLDNEVNILVIAVGGSDLSAAEAATKLLKYDSGNITGATVTSNAIMDAVKSALESAKK